MGSCLSQDVGVCRWRSNLTPSSSGPVSPRLGLRKAKKVRRRRQGSSRGLSFKYKHVENQLHRIPGRMFLNGASSIASLFTQQGKKGTNQDAMLVWENFGSIADTVFCGVFDGHGPFGHMVARRVRDSLPLKLSAHWELNLGANELRQNSISTTESMTSEETASICLEDESKTSIDFEEEKIPEIVTTLKDSFLKAFKVMDKELKVNPHIDCFCSGTTAVTLVKQETHIEEKKEMKQEDILKKREKTKRNKKRKISKSSSSTTSTPISTSAKEVKIDCMMVRVEEKNKNEVDDSTYD